MSKPPGPKELQRRQMREDRFSQKGGKKLSTSDLRQSIAKIKPMSHKGGKRQR
jgi:hypothetical protein